MLMPFPDMLTMRAGISMLVPFSMTTETGWSGSKRVSLLRSMTSFSAGHDAIRGETLRVSLHPEEELFPENQQPDGQRKQQHQPDLDPVPAILLGVLRTLAAPSLDLVGNTELDAAGDTLDGPDEL